MGAHRLAKTLGAVAVGILLAWSLFFLTAACRAQEASEGVVPGFSGAVSQIQENNTLRQKGSNQYGPNHEYSSMQQSSIENSFQGAKGIVTVNQSSGNLNNQAIAAWLSVSETSTFPNVLGTAVLQNNKLETTNAFYSVSIGPQAFLSGQGLVAINQVAGNMNNQFTTLAINVGRQPAPKGSTNVAVTTGDGNALVALSNAQLTQIVASQNNQVTNNGSLTAKAKLEDGAFQDFKGVVATTLTAGNMNQVMNHVSLQITATP
jgi:hypothetical protein